MQKKKYPLFPAVKEPFFYGNIISGRSLGDVVYLASRRKYCFRLQLVFESGDVRTVQRTSSDKQTARMERDLALMHIARGTFIPFSYTVREFYEYWFYHHMIGEKRISYNTYTSYRSILNNHILPVIGHQKLDCLQRKDLIRALRKIPSRNVQRTAIGMISGSLRYAQERSYFPVNIYSGLNYELKKSGLFQKETKTEANVYTVEQDAHLLHLCRKQEPQIYLPMLLAVTAGLRVSEAIGLKYEDIDFLNKKLTVTRQLGRSLYPENSHIERPALSQEIQLKTARSHRQVELADFVLDEILLERQRYEKRKAEDPGFQNLGYICCQKDGRCYNRRFYTDAYNRILQQCEFPRLEWRKFRNTYATILSDYQVHIKTISQCLGHYSPDFTKKVYVFVKEPDVYDISHAIGEYVSTNRLLPVPRSWKETDVYLLPGDSVYREYFLNNFYSI